MSESSHSLFASAPYIRRICSLSAEQLETIDLHLHRLIEQDSRQLRKTHYFHGRHENIYIDTGNSASSLPELDQLMEESLNNCAELLQVDVAQLKLGYWFNLMEPGQITTLHRHDDFDEVISGVVYLTVPENSGDLVLVTGHDQIRLPPMLGHFIYFDPKTPHRVSENRSGLHRLSIGMNIGLIENDA